MGLIAIEFLYCLVITSSNKIILDTNNIYHGSLSLLMIVVVLLSYSVEGVYPSNPFSSLDSSQENSLCKNVHQPSLEKNKDKPSEINRRNEESSPSQRTTMISSCSLSLQVIPVEKQRLVPPRKTSFAFPPFPSAISSQAFVFQEPDPPQINCR